MAPTSVVAALVRAGIRTVFGVPGGPIAPVFDARRHEPSIRLVTTRIESTSVFAAAGYARVSGEPVACLFTARFRTAPRTGSISSA